ncbi:hypothetical protein VCUG_01880 [Vavraia culicis subsp. floridensis]|uniref:Uncharacterized protein n=1 Tax=Vavraia culicis (isolate floridensis) TaxID=948595 RepID=L2GSP0_VAVCU|nr:uncharacterized protein VCUG_01880 [Vavraia culicis subsp. floridensis]ELA46654.1 hypothetical protein VCUG_01880 [Vavraia culicis subsp. floridensis]
MGRFGGSFNFGSKGHSSPAAHYSSPHGHNGVHSPSSKRTGSDKSLTTMATVSLIISCTIYISLGILLIVTWYIIYVGNRKLTKKLKSAEVADITAEYIDKDAHSTVVIMYGCTINGENCLSVFPLREYGHRLFESEIAIDEKMQNRSYFRKHFIQVMLSYSKEQNNLLYIPQRNLREKRPFFMWYTRVFIRFNGKSLDHLLNSAIEFINCVFEPTFFSKNKEFITFCILNKSRIDVEVYQCTDTELIPNAGGSFHFDENLAVEYFSYIMDSLTEKVAAEQIDKLIDTAIFNEEKIRMSLQNIERSYNIVIPPSQR